VSVRILAIAAACVVLAAVSVLVAARLRPRTPTLGLENGRLRPCPGSPNCVSSEGGPSGSSVLPIAWSGSADDAIRELGSLLSRMPRVTVVASDRGYLHAEFRSRLFGYVDDFEARWDGAARCIQVRSASRSGHSDLGVNRRRVEWVRSALEKR
jgi:uncharacterized protein (DUF1499 family)